MNLRPEIKTFCDAAETLLCPAIMQGPLTEEERSMVEVYMSSLERLISKGTAATAPARRVF